MKATTRRLIALEVAALGGPQLSPELLHWLGQGPAPEPQANQGVGDGPPLKHDIPRELLEWLEARAR